LQHTNCSSKVISAKSNWTAIQLSIKLFSGYK
jgi:hypothetical protein